jgi:hypothetical protein
MNFERGDIEYYNINEIIPEKGEGEEFLQYNNSETSDNTEHTQYRPLKESDEFICDVCGEEDIYIKNKLYTCNRCLFSTHQTCHGGAIFNNIKIKNWICKCQSNEPTVICIFCGTSDGLMRQSTKGWFHMDCVSWNCSVDYWVDDE